MRLILSLAAAVVALSTATAQDVLDGIAAVVNGEVITFSQVREVVGAREQALRDTLKGEELVNKVKETRQAALNELIDRQLILQEFKKNKFSIPDYVVEDRIKVIVREDFGGDRAAFVRTLQAQGYTLDKFKQTQQDSIIASEMRRQSTKTNLMVSPQKVQEYYQANQPEFSEPEQVKLRMIVLKGDTGSEDKKAMASEIKAKVAGGADFGKLAELYSEDSTRESGGDWGWIDRKTLNDELTKAAFGLRAGEVSEPIHIGDSSYILFVEARKNASVKPLDEVRDGIEKKLLQEERQKLQEKWIAGLRKKAFIKTY